MDVHLFLAAASRSGWFSPQAWAVLRTARLAAVRSGGQVHLPDCPDSLAPGAAATTTELSRLAHWDLFALCARCGLSPAAAWLDGIPPALAQQLEGVSRNFAVVWAELATARPCPHLGEAGGPGPACPWQSLAEARHWAAVTVAWAGIASVARLNPGTWSPRATQAALEGVRRSRESLAQSVTEIHLGAQAFARLELARLGPPTAGVSRPDLAGLGGAPASASGVVTRAVLAAHLLATRDCEDSYRRWAMRELHDPYLRTWISDEGEQESPPCPLDAPVPEAVANVIDRVCREKMFVEVAAPGAGPAPAGPTSPAPAPVVDLGMRLPLVRPHDPGMNLWLPLAARAAGTRGGNLAVVEVPRLVGDLLVSAGFARDLGRSLLASNAELTEAVELYSLDPETWIRMGGMRAIVEVLRTLADGV